jgi:hypothetical protein
VSTVFLAHPRVSALPYVPQHLPELHVVQAEPPIRRSPSSRGCRWNAAVELAPPPLLQAPWHAWHLLWVTWKLPVQHVVEPRPFPHRHLASRGRVAAAPPPPLAGALTGRSTATNRSQVRPIDDPRRMFAWPSPTSPLASWFPPSCPRGMDRGYICEDFKSFRVPCARRFFLVLWISPAPCKIN